MGDDRDAGECHRRASADDRNDKSPNPEEVGPLTLVYETKVVTADDIGGVALDEHGRELEIRYGIVLRGRDGGAANNLPHGVRECALASYREFLADEESFDVEASDPVPLTADPPSAAPPQEQRPHRRPRTIVVIMAGVVVAIVIAVVPLMRGVTTDERAPVKTPVATASPAPAKSPTATPSAVPTQSPPATGSAAPAQSPTTMPPAAPANSLTAPREK